MCSLNLPPPLATSVVSLAYYYHGVNFRKIVYSAPVRVVDMTLVSVGKS